MKEKAEEILEMLNISFIDIIEILKFDVKISYKLGFRKTNLDGRINVQQNRNGVLYSSMEDLKMNIPDAKTYREVIEFDILIKEGNQKSYSDCLRNGDLELEKFKEDVLEAVAKFHNLIDYFDISKIINDISLQNGSLFLKSKLNYIGDEYEYDPVIITSKVKSR